MKLICGTILVVLASTSFGAEKSYPAWDGKEGIADYAKRVGLNATDSLDLGGGVKLELILVPAGSFLMGSPAEAPAGAPKDLQYVANQEKQHKVTLTQPFYMGKYEVTQAQY